MKITQCLNNISPFLGGLTCLAALSGCAELQVSDSGPAEAVERGSYHKLNGVEKAIYLAYYPDLTPSQRKDLLWQNESGMRFLLAEWGLESKFFRNRKDNLSPFIAKPENYRFKDLEIIVTPGAVTQGTSVELKAIAHYQDGRTVDVTDAVKWDTDWSLAGIENGTLRFGCIASSLTIEADFLGEAHGSNAVKIEKTIKKLEVRLSGAYQGMLEPESIRLEAIARCQDGTATDVSCQADWEGNVPVSGCGNVTLGKREHRDHPIKVFATYGGLRGSLRFHPFK